MLLLPYGNEKIPFDEKNAAVLESRVDQLKSDRPGIEIVRAAMENSIGSPRLSALARGKKNAVVIISDHTRPVPSRDILPPMLAELRQGSPDIDITLLVATGFHRLTTRSELTAKLGDEIVSREKIVVHDAHDPAANVPIGVLPSGAPLVIDRLAAGTELLVAEGFIEPHFFAGFSGGRKSVLPGICDAVTVLGNHCGAFIASDRARTGMLDGNPIDEDMLAACALAKLQYIVNVIIDEKQRTVAAFAGNHRTAHRQGAELLRQYCAVKAVPGDIVVTTNGGAPMDQNIYQSVKSMTAAEATANKDAVLIVCAECADGTGSDTFYRALRDCESPAALLERYLRTPQNETEPDQWESQILARILNAHRVIMVTRPALAQTVREMKMTYAATLDEAFAEAVRAKGPSAAVAVIPNGISVIVER